MAFRLGENENDELMNKVHLMQNGI